MRAPEYVRMSTEHRRYSIANQQAAISDYAKCNGFEVVRTYRAQTRSGLGLAHRKGLTQLLVDSDWCTSACHELADGLACLWKIGRECPARAAEQLTDGLLCTFASEL
jgi:hypothetical protein